MKNQDFKISINTIWFLVVGNFLLTIVGALAKVQHWEFSNIIFTVALMLFFTTWVIILSDMVKQKIYNKTFWVMSMFIFPTLASIVYLLRRNTLLNAK